MDFLRPAKEFLISKKRTRKNRNELKLSKLSCLRNIKKLKITNKNWKGLQRFSVLIGSLQLSYYISNMTILIGLVLLSSFQFLWVLLYSQKCVNSPQEVFIHQASKVNWTISILGVLDISPQQETKKKGRHDCNEKETTPL